MWSLVPLALAVPPDPPSLAELAWVDSGPGFEGLLCLARVLQGYADRELEPTADELAVLLAFSCGELPEVRTESPSQPGG